MIFQLVEQFKIIDVLGIYPKKFSKNIITIDFNSFNKDKSSITVDLITDTDSKDLTTKIKKLIKDNQNNN